MRRHRKTSTFVLAGSLVSVMMLWLACGETKPKSPGNTSSPSIETANKEVSASLEKAFTRVFKAAEERLNEAKRVVSEHPKNEQVLKRVRAAQLKLAMDRRVPKKILYKDLKARLETMASKSWVKVSDLSLGTGPGQETLTLAELEDKAALDARVFAEQSFAVGLSRPAKLEQLLSVEDFHQQLPKTFDYFVTVDPKIKGIEKLRKEQKLKAESTGKADKALKREGWATKGALEISGKIKVLRPLGLAKSESTNLTIDALAASLNVEAPVGHPRLEELKALVTEYAALQDTLEAARATLAEKTIESARLRVLRHTLKSRTRARSAKSRSRASLQRGDAALRGKGPKGFKRVPRPVRAKVEKVPVPGQNGETKRSRNE